MRLKTSLRLSEISFRTSKALPRRISATPPKTARSLSNRLPPTLICCWWSVPTTVPTRTSAIPQMRFGKIDDLSSRVTAAIGGADNYLFSQQHEEGYWCGELEADTTLESDYIMLHTLLGTGDMDRFRKAARYILQHQNEDGGWPIYAGGPSNVSASVKAYFGLRLAGFTADHSALVRARKKILELGGVTEVNTFTK